MAMDWEVRQNIANLFRNDERLAGELRSIQEELARERQTVGAEHARRLVVDIYRETSSYVNLVMIAGYAGAFGLWQFTKDELSRSVSAWSALLLSTSILLFVVFEVQKMIREGLRLRDLAHAIQSLPPDRRLQVVDALLSRGNVNQAGVWLWLTVPTVATGLAAGVLLLAAFVARVCGYQLLP